MALSLRKIRGYMDRVRVRCEIEKITKPNFKLYQIIELNFDFKKVSRSFKPQIWLKLQKVIITDVAKFFQNLKISIFQFLLFSIRGKVPSSGLIFGL